MKKLLSIILSAVIAVSASSLIVSAKSVKVGTPKLKSVSPTDSKVLKISWSKVSGAKGYVLYRKDSGSKFKTIAAVKNTSYTNKKLKSNVKYYYKVKAYKTNKSKKVYGKFSNTKSKTAIVLYSAEDMYKKSVKDILKIMGNKFSVKAGWIETSYYFYNYEKLPGMDFYFNIKWGDTTPAKELIKNAKIKIEGIEVNKNGLGLRRNKKMIKADYDYKKCCKILGKKSCKFTSGAMLSGAPEAVGYTLSNSKYNITINFKHTAKTRKLLEQSASSIPYSTMIKENPKIKCIVINKNYS